MSSLKKQRLVSRLARSPMSYVTLFLLSALFIWSATGVYSKSRLAKERLESARGRLLAMEEQRSKLAADLEYANTPFGEEKALREKFNVVKEGENVIMIVEEEPVAETKTTENMGRFEAWLRKIFGR